MLDAANNTHVTNSKQTSNTMTAINPQLRMIFESSFEELSVTDPRPPDFSMWGKNYLGRWRHHTMTLFLNDLNEMIQATEEANELREADLSNEVERLEEELKEARKE